MADFIFAFDPSNPFSARIKREHHTQARFKRQNSTTKRLVISIYLLALVAIPQIGMIEVRFTCSTWQLRKACWIMSISSQPRATRPSIRCCSHCLTKAKISSIGFRSGLAKCKWVRKWKLTFTTLTCKLEETASAVHWQQENPKTVGYSANSLEATYRQMNYQTENWKNGGTIVEHNDWAGSRKRRCHLHLMLQVRWS